MINAACAKWARKIEVSFDSRLKIRQFGVAEFNHVF